MALIFWKVLGEKGAFITPCPYRLISNRLEFNMHYKVEEKCYNGPVASCPTLELPSSTESCFRLSYYVTVLKTMFQACDSDK